VEKKTKILPATHLLHLSISKEKNRNHSTLNKLVRELKKQLQINLRRRGRRRVWIKAAAAAAAATYYSAINEKLAAKLGLTGKRKKMSKKRNVISSTKIHLSLNKSISRGVKNGLTILLWILQLCSFQIPYELQHTLGPSTLIINTNSIYILFSELLKWTFSDLV
jgi:hypothetical protein